MLRPMPVYGPTSRRGAAHGTWQWLLLSAGVVGLDQWSKWLVVRHFELYETLRLLPVFNLTRAHNQCGGLDLRQKAADTGQIEVGILDLGVKPGQHIPKIRAMTHVS